MQTDIVESNNVIGAIEAELNKIAKQNQSIFNGDWGLLQTKNTAKLLGNPQDWVKAIHIAGTSGKGSSAYYLSALLIAHGFKVVTMTSPHIRDIRERAMLNLSWAPDHSYKKAFDQLISLIKHKKIPTPSFYEAIVFWGFNLVAIEKPDYQVVEVGVGGLLDSTNIITRQDKLSVITRLGLDHTEILGKTIAQITKQKAGIMNNGGTTIALEPKEKGAKKMLEAEAKKHENKLIYSKPIEIKQLMKDIPNHQVEDMILAVNILHFLAKRDGFRVNEKAIAATLNTIKIPGRWDEFNYHGRSIMVDGAHNPQKIDALVNATSNLYKKVPVWLVGVKKDKDTKAMLSTISKHSLGVGFCEFFKNEDNPRLKKMAQSKESLSILWMSMRKEPPLSVKEHSIEAFLSLDKQLPKNVPIIVTGSMYMVGEFLKAFEKLTEQK